MNKLRILGITQDQSASRYHRVELPLNALRGKIVNVDGEDREIEVDYTTSFDPPMEMMEKYDIIYNNFVCKITTTQIGALQAMGKKFILDIDDSGWEGLPKGHPMRKSVGNGYSILPILSALSDVTICATDRIALEMSKFTNKVSVLYNDLPVGNGQFQLVEKREREEKVRLGIIGSYSHLMDYESYKVVIDKILGDKYLQEKCKFVIARGEGEIWDKIVAIFSSNPLFEVELIDCQPVENYMQLYSKVDILLGFLKDVDYNRCKSALKIMEASLYNIPVVASPLYAEKEISGVVVAKNNKAWITTLKELVKDNFYIEIGEKLSKVNREMINFEGRIENLRKIVEWLMNNESIDTPPNLKIYSIKYLEDQIVEYTPYMNINKETPWRFEYESMINLLSNKVDNSDLDGKDYVGLLSWKFPYKTNVPKKLLYNILYNELKTRKYDVLNLSPRYWGDSEEYLKFSYEQHPELEKLLKLCLTNLGVEYTEKLPTVIYSNFFLMKKELYQEYVNTWVIPTLKYMEEDIWNLVNVDAQYKSGLASEKLKEYTGLDFYNYTTFIIERMILFYINSKKLTVKNII